MLDRERRFFVAHAEEWAKAYPARFLVVKGERLIGDFATIDEALSAGARRFGLQPFLVRRAGEMEETVSVPALTLGLLGANP
jgi:hypothetical protein